MSDGFLPVGVASDETMKAHCSARGPFALVRIYVRFDDVVDEKPKSLKHNQIEGLRILADQIVSLIENDTSKNTFKKVKKKQGKLGLEQRTLRLISFVRLEEVFTQ